MVAEISRRVGSNVRRFRRERDLTQARMVEELAGSGLELSESMLSRLEHGQRTVTVDQLVALAEVLDVAPVDLLDVPVPQDVPEPAAPVVVLDPNMLRALASLAITADLQATMSTLMASTASSATQTALTNIARMAGANMEEVVRRNIAPLMKASQAALAQSARPVSGQEG